jgi:hypothetical protein
MECRKGLAAYSGAGCLLRALGLCCCCCCSCAQLELELRMDYGAALCLRGLEKSDFMGVRTTVEKWKKIVKMRSLSAFNATVAPQASSSSRCPVAPTMRGGAYRQAPLPATSYHGQARSSSLTVSTRASRASRRAGIVCAGAKLTYGTEENHSRSHSYRAYRYS